MQPVIENKNDSSSRIRVRFQNVHIINIYTHTHIYSPAHDFAVAANIAVSVTSMISVNFVPYRRGSKLY